MPRRKSSLALSDKVGSVSTKRCRGRPNYKSMATGSRDDDIDTGSHTTQSKRQRSTAPSSDFAPSSTGLTGNISVAGDIAPPTTPHQQRTPATNVDTAALVAQITAQVLAQLQPATNATNTVTVTHQSVEAATHSVPESFESDSQDDTPALITGAIHGILEGETSSPCKPDDFQSVSLPLGSTVKTKLKAKIWADEYIDLRSLLKDTEDEEITFKVLKARGESSLSMSSPNSKMKHMDDIQE